MKLRTFLAELNTLVKSNPEALDYNVIYSSDDEGNSYHNVHCTGALVKVEDLDEHHLEIAEFLESNANAVIIN